MLQNNRAKALVLRYFETVWNQQKLEEINEFLAPSFIGHERNADDVYGLSGIQIAANNFFQNFPNATFTIIKSVAEGDIVAVHLYFEAAHPKASHPIKVAGMIFLRLVEGKIAETWSN